jgi:predicted  nucleic acid-binding Zn-ribbon protein
LSDLDGELERARGGLFERKQQLQELTEKLERDRLSVLEMERMRNDLQQELRQMNQQIEKSREKLGRCRTEREANAAQRELEELRKLHRDREQEVEKLTALLDLARAEIDTANAKRDEVAGELGTHEGPVTNRLGEVEERQAVQRAAREQVVLRISKLDGKVYRRYETIRKRKGTAIAFTTDGSCSACHVRMPPQLVQKLKRQEEFGQCPSCNRIIYFRDPAEVSGQPSDRSATGP